MCGSFMFGLSQFIDKLIKTSLNYDFELLQSYYILLGKMNQDSIFCTDLQLKMQISVSEQLIFIFGKMTQYPQKKLLDYTSLLLGHLLNGYESYTNILSVLSSDNSFLLNVNTLISKNMSKGCISTNDIFCQKYSIIKQVSQLIIKVINKNHKE